MRYVFQQLMACCKVHCAIYTYQSIRIQSSFSSLTSFGLDNEGDEMQFVQTCLLQLVAHRALQPLQADLNRVLGQTILSVLDILETLPVMSKI